MVNTVSTYTYTERKQGTARRTAANKRVKKLRASHIAKFTTVVAFFFLLFIGFMIMKGNATTAIPEAPTASEQVIVVGSGDTLWAIASEVKGSGEDIREVIYSIKQRNGLRERALHAGQSLIIPADH
ncbi:LysM peptidoglycan-binding domain-containing protein [Paenibacillus xanthanilyticus]|uniref:LysM peptidoglycan-binding domain-containing protein n=1 Tax=Paenibacillus xanthanilyticus TaxID=1783531 RepID=A0ABV8K501_9BACL